MVSVLGMVGCGNVVNSVWIISNFLHSCMRRYISYGLHTCNHAVLVLAGCLQLCKQHAVGVVYASVQTYRQGTNDKKLDTLMLHVFQSP